jgi:hypothetical protein
MVRFAQTADIRGRDNEGQIDPEQTTEATEGRLIRGLGKRQFEVPRRRLAEVPVEVLYIHDNRRERCAVVSNAQTPAIARRATDCARPPDMAHGLLEHLRR